MKIIYNNYIPVKGFLAMNLFGVLFVRGKKKKLSKVTLNHEAIHTEQMKELLYIPFYLVYCIEYLINLFRFKFNGHTAYRNISFEKEAYSNQNNLCYLKAREHFAQWK